MNMVPPHLSGFNGPAITERRRFTRSIGGLFCWISSARRCKLFTAACGPRPTTGPHRADHNPNTFRKPAMRVLSCTEQIGRAA